MTSGVLTDSEVRDPLARAAAADEPTGWHVPESVRRKLARPVLAEHQGWLITGVVVLVAAVLRLYNLSQPSGIIFDETYYANEANSMLEHGVEYDDKGNPKYVVHPPLGKWAIGLGIRLFGFNEFGWRIAAAVAGIVSVLIIVRTARRLLRSNVLGGAAGLLIALDGMHLVLSRTALLDVFLMVFVVAAFGCLVLDREQRRARWLAALEHGLDPDLAGRDGRPPFTVPWWRLAAAVMMGCALAVKWSALFYLLAFLVLIVLWEVGARRTVGARHPWVDTFIAESGWLLAFVGIVVAVYVASWTGWFATDTGYYRHWLRDSQGIDDSGVFGALTNWWHYHSEAYNFHKGLSEGHRYQSWPWQWLLLARPVAFFYSSSEPCGGPSCAAEVILLGTPLLWWSFLPALAALTWLGIARRDWRAGAIGMGAAAGLLPWFYYALDGRTMFYFYALPAEPFLALAVVYVLGAVIGPAPQSIAGQDRRLIGVILVGAYMLIIAACFAYFYPIYVGSPLTYEEWYARMWLGGRWI